MVLGAVGGNLDDFDGQLDDPGGFSDDQDPASLSVLKHLKALSWRGKLTLVYVVAVVISLMAILDWVIALMSLLAFFVSAGPLYLWWARIRFSCPLDLVVRSFGLGIIGMFWSVVILMYLLTKFLLLPVLLCIGLLFNNALAPFITVSILFVGLEEMVKVALVHWSKRDVAVGRETKAHQIAATATSVGYAVGFSFLMIALLDCSMDDILGIKYDSWSDVLVGLFALAITTVFGTPLHVLSGYLVGLEVTRQTHFMKAALYSFGLRSLFLINILLWIRISTSWQMLVFGIFMTNIVLCAMMVRRIKRVESTLPVEYLQRVGYLQAFGYGVLPGDNVDEVEIPGNIDVNTLV